MERMQAYADRNGYRIRKARKSGQCDWWAGSTRGGRCKHIIQVGEQYMAGELDPYKAGGYGQDRWCSEHFHDC